MRTESVGSVFFFVLTMEANSQPRKERKGVNERSAD